MVLLELLWRLVAVTIDTVVWLVAPIARLLHMIIRIVWRTSITAVWISWYIVRCLTATKLRAALLVIVLALAPFVARAFLRLPLAGWQNELLVDTTLQPNAKPEIPIDAIMVLGYSCYHRLGLPTAPLEQRLQVAFDAACQQRLAPLIVLSGGRSQELNPTRPTESEIMAHWMLERLLDLSSSAHDDTSSDSVQDSQLWRTIKQSSVLSIVAEHPTCQGVELTLVLEKESTSTVLNARNSLAILNLNYSNVSRLLLVTNLFHQWRSRRVFERAARDLETHRAKCFNDTTTTTTTTTTIASDSAATSSTATATATAALRRYSFEVAYVPPPRNDCVIQKDFWRELAAIALYYVAGWI